MSTSPATADEIRPSAGMRVAVIDPSSFTMPYDHCLCESLQVNGCDVLFVGSKYLYAAWRAEYSYERWDHFYGLTNRVYGSNRRGLVRQLVKGLEHCVDMLSLVLRLRRWRPDIVHFQWLPVPTLDRLVLPLLSRDSPLVLTVHDTNPYRGTAGAALTRGFRQVIGMFDHLIAHAQFTKSQLVDDLGVSGRKVSIVPHGAFTYYGQQESSPITPSTDTRREVLFFGTLKPYKGLDVLIRALSILPESLRNEIVLKVASYPATPPEPYVKLAESLRVADSIVWDLRFVPEEEVAPLFLRASVVVLPYREIDQSGALMTALAFRKPVIVTRVGAFPETIADGVHGLVVEPDDPPALAAALAVMLSDPDRADAMSRAVDDLVETDLSWAHIGRQTIQVYRQVIDGVPSHD